MGSFPVGRHGNAEGRMRAPDGLRCPVCGKGVVQDLGFDAESTTDLGRPVQDPEAREWVRFTCGHQVEGSKLETADQEGLDVERRSSEDTTDVPSGGPS